MKQIPPFPWKPVLVLLFLTALLAGIVRLVVHDWWRGAALLAVGYGLFRLWLRLWPPAGSEPETSHTPEETP